MIFLALLVWPFLEIFVAFAVIRDFGFMNAFFGWLLTLVLGVGLFRTSSLRLTIGVARAMQEGKAPALTAVDGALIGLAGVLLLLPGYISDAMALILLIPPIRRLFAKRLLKAFSIRTGGLADFEASAGPSFDASSAIIDVEAVVVDEKPRPVSQIQKK